jgi:molybdate transport system permease protein
VIPATRRPPAGAYAVAGLAVALFALPLIGLLQKVSWADLVDDLTTQEARDALRLSLTASAMSTLLSVALGLPLAWVLARGRFPGRAFVRGLVLLPMVLPPVVGGVALLGAFSLHSPVGSWLNDAFGLQFTFHRSGVVMAETFVSMPFFVLTVEGALRGLDPRFEQAAAGLGASRLRTFRRVTLPLIAPSVFAGAVLAWARALGEFGATITFAGNITGRTRTLPLAVYLDLGGTDDQAAFALSLVLLLISFVVLVAMRDRWFGRR